MVLLSISPFMSVSVCLMYQGSPMLGAWTFTIFVSSFWIDPLTIMQCPSLSLVMFFILRYILSDMRIATPAFYFFPFVWNTFFCPLTFSLYVSLGLKGFLVENIYMGLAFVSIQSVCVFWLEHLIHLHLKVILYIFPSAFP